jgi:hypothetical protein
LLAATSRAWTSCPQPCFEATNEISYERMAQFCGAAFVDRIDLTGRVFFVPKPRRQGGLATRRAIFLSAGGGVSAQHRGCLTVANSEALFQDDRPTSGATIATHSSRLFSVRAVPEARSFRARVAGPRRNSHQSRQQQLPRFRAPLVGEVYLSFRANENLDSSRRSFFLHYELTL